MSMAAECHDRCGLPYILNNKLAIILGTCELLSQDTTDPELLDRVRRIREATQGALDEINKSLSQHRRIDVRLISDPARNVLPRNREKSLMLVLFAASALN